MATSAAGLPALDRRSTHAYPEHSSVSPPTLRGVTPRINIRRGALIIHYQRISLTVAAAAGTLAERSAQPATTLSLPPTSAVQRRDHDHGAQPKAEELPFLEAQLRLLANAASDRAEMHAILAQQRDNWNKLFQNTLTLASLSACLLSALTAGATSSVPSLHVPALLLNAGCAAVMSVVNHFQPSQLAEEQRSAARQFRRLVKDVEGALQAPLHVRQHTPTLLQESQQRLRALDAAFPMPLTLKGGLDKFPSKVTPPALLNVTDRPDRPTPVPAFAEQAASCKGWDGRMSRRLQQLAMQVRHSDTDMYVGWAQNVVKVNKCLAIAAPLLAASAAVLNGVGLIHSTINGGTLTGTLAAICSLTSAFVGSISHDLQLGTVFEMYRNAAGHYAEVEQSIHNALQIHPLEREHGLIFLQRIAYKLGRWDDAVNPELPHHK